MSRAPLSPAYGIGAGIKYGLAIWIGAAALTYGGWCALDAGREVSKHMKLASQETDFGVSYRTANGGQP